MNKILIQYFYLIKILLFLIFKRGLYVVFFVFKYVFLNLKYTLLNLDPHHSSYSISQLICKYSITKFIR